MDKQHDFRVRRLVKFLGWMNDMADGEIDRVSRRDGEWWVAGKLFPPSRLKHVEALLGQQVADSTASSAEPR